MPCVNVAALVNVGGGGGSRGYSVFDRLGSRLPDPTPTIGGSEYCLLRVGFVGGEVDAVFTYGDSLVERLLGFGMSLLFEGVSAERRDGRAADLRGVSSSLWFS